MEFEFILLLSPLVWFTPPGLPKAVTYAFTNIQQLAEVEEEEEEESDTPQIDSWRNV